MTPRDLAAGSRTRAWRTPESAASESRGRDYFFLTTRTVSVQIGILMLVALVGLHLGFGILIAVYRLIDKLA